MIRRLRQLSTLQWALLVSLAVHAALLTVRFVDPEGFKRVLDDTPLEVVLVNASTAAQPQTPQVIAQRNLAGGGDAAQGRASSPLPPMAITQFGDALEDSRRQVEQMQVQQMLLLAQVKRELATLPTPDQKQTGTPNLRPAEEDRRRQLVAKRTGTTGRQHEWDAQADRSGSVDGSVSPRQPAARLH